eukprot:765697-Hanusia_phi.AAC.4
MNSSSQQNRRLTPYSHNPQQRAGALPVPSSSARLPSSTLTILASSTARASLYKIALSRACPNPSSKIRSCI